MVKERERRKERGKRKGREKIGSEGHPLLYGSLPKAPGVVKGGAVRPGRRAYPAGSARPPCNTSKTERVRCLKSVTAE